MEATTDTTPTPQTSSAASANQLQTDSIAGTKPAPAQASPSTMAGDNAAPATGKGDAGNKYKGKGRKSWDKFNKKRQRNNNDNGSDRPSKKSAEDNPKTDYRATRNGRRAWGENPFTTEEIAAEEKRPKRKVAVMMGYSGTGYKGLQINKKEKTIEGDVMKAFIEAGAISKANADDPQKVSLVRCARTDKGVHAAGNVLSLKLIIEDEDIVDKINAALPPQIRVWGIQRTNNNFNCYEAVDSRWYEYLLPSYSLIPPHPDSFIGKKIVEYGKEKGVLEAVAERNKDCEGFWDNVDEELIKPILANLEAETRAVVIDRIRSSIEVADGGESLQDSPVQSQRNMEQADDVPMANIDQPTQNDGKEPKEPTDTSDEATSAARSFTAVDFALRDIKRAIVSARRKYRISQQRLAQLQAALNQYVGTNNFHNYTIQKPFKDSSAKRHIKSFEVNPKPIIINDTEWLSLKVHGQSFMMHQIRKMVGMATLLVRCGGDIDLIKETYGPQRIAIPKAPALGLLLECPVFTSYNTRAINTFEKEPIDFAKYREKIDAFKREFIYNRIFEDEEKEYVFHSFYQQVDNFRTDYFLWVTPGGLEAADNRIGVRGDQDIENALNRQLGQEHEDRNQEEQEG